MSPKRMRLELSNVVLTILLGQGAVWLPVLIRLRLVSSQQCPPGEFPHLDSTVLSGTTRLIWRDLNKLTVTVRTCAPFPGRAGIGFLAAELAEIIIEVLFSSLGTGGGGGCGLERISKCRHIS